MPSFDQDLKTLIKKVQDLLKILEDQARQAVYQVLDRAYESQPSENQKAWLNAVAGQFKLNTDKRLWVVGEWVVKKNDKEATHTLLEANPQFAQSLLEANPRLAQDIGYALKRRNLGDEARKRLHNIWGDSQYGIPKGYKIEGDDKWARYRQISKLASGKQRLDEVWWKLSRIQPLSKEPNSTTHLSMPILNQCFQHVKSLRVSNIPRTPNLSPASHASIDSKTMKRRRAPDAADAESRRRRRYSRLHSSLPSPSEASGSDMGPERGRRADSELSDNPSLFNTQIAIGYNGSKLLDSVEEQGLHAITDATWDIDVGEADRFDSEGICYKSGFDGNDDADYDNHGEMEHENEAKINDSDDRSINENNEGDGRPRQPSYSDKGPQDEKFAGDRVWRNVDVDHYSQQAHTVEVIDLTKDDKGQEKKVWIQDQPRPTTVSEDKRSIPEGKWLNSSEICSVLKNATGIYDIVVEQCLEDLSRVLWRPPITKETRLLFIPWQIIPHHWAVAIFDFRTGEVEVYDSLNEEEPSCSDQQVQLLNLVIQWLISALPASKTVQRIDWTVVAKKSPRQQNNDDCGVHVILNSIYRSLGLSIPRQYDTGVWRVFVDCIIGSQNDNQVPSPGSALATVSNAELLFQACSPGNALATLNEAETTLTVLHERYNESRPILEGKVAELRESTGRLEALNPATMRKHDDNGFCEDFEAFKESLCRQYKNIKQRMNNLSNQELGLLRALRLCNLAQVHAQKQVEEREFRRTRIRQYEEISEKTEREIEALKDKLRTKAEEKKQADYETRRLRLAENASPR